MIDGAVTTVPKVVAVTGSTGFVGSNISAMLQKYGHEVIGLGRTQRADAPWPIRVVDFSSEAEISDNLVGVDAVVHCAIANDFNRLVNDRDYAYDSFVGLTSRITRAARAHNTQMIYISTDWVVDGTQHLCAETERGNAVNYYGYLKALGEQVVRDIQPEIGAICRIAGVMGRHQLDESGPRAQDVGFGYFVYSLVGSLRSGEPFTVWNGPHVNQITSPSLAAEIGAQIDRVIARRVGGTLHLVGDDAVERMELAKLVCEIFDLDSGLLREGLPPESELFPAPVPRDSSLSNVLTKKLLGLSPTPLRQLLTTFREELETGVPIAITKPE
ncbi:MAG: SDR family oxidoreductase [Microbacteriaceae bacterium]